MYYFGKSHLAFKIIRATLTKTARYGKYETFLVILQYFLMKLQFIHLTLFPLFVNSEFK